MTKEKLKPLFKQILKFGIVGGIATIIDWLVFRFTVYNLGIDVFVGNVISFAVSVIYNYWASTKWVFETDHIKNHRTVFIEFILFALVGMGITEGILFVGVNIMHKDAMIVKVFGTFVSMCFNFITRKIVLEKQIVS